MAHPVSNTIITLRLPRLDEAARLQVPSDTRFFEALALLAPLLATRGTEEVTSESTLVIDATLYPPRELGSVGELRLLTLFQLGLFPSGTLDLVRPADRGKDEELWTVTVKPVCAPSTPLTVGLLRPRDTVHMLKARLAVAHPSLCGPADCLVLVHQGQVLVKGDESLRTAGLGHGASLVSVRREGATAPPPIPTRHTPPPDLATPLRSHAASSLGQLAPPTSPSAVPGAGAAAGEAQSEGRASFPGAAAAPGPAAPGAAEAADDNSPMCRICHGGAEDGPLVRPCRCAGSMRHCHLDCLNTWRRLAPTEASFRRCDQCLFEYRFDRSRLAAFLLSDAGGVAVAGAACLCLLYAGAWLVHLLVPGRWVAKLLDAAWTPSLPHVVVLGNRRLPVHKWCPRFWAWLQGHLTFAVTGAYAFGAAGFLDYVRTEVWVWVLRRRHDPVNQLYNNAHLGVTVAWLWALLSGHGDFGRVVVVVGFAVSSRGFVLVAHARAREAATNLGERLLEVN